MPTTGGHSSFRPPGTICTFISATASMLPSPDACRRCPAPRLVAERPSAVEPDTTMLFITYIRDPPLQIAGGESSWRTRRCETKIQRVFHADAFFLLATSRPLLGSHERSRKEMRRCATVKEKMSFGPTTMIFGVCFVVPS